MKGIQMRVRGLLVPLAAVALLVSACSGGTPATPTQSTSGSAASAPASQPTKAAAPAASSTQPDAATKGSTTPSASTKAPAGAQDMETVPMPGGGTKFDWTRPVKVGDVLDLPLSGLVMQVTAAKTADYDAKRDMVLVDLIIGNKGKEKATISSALMMSVVTADWRWYALGLDMNGIMALAPKIAELKVRTFDGDIPTGQARKATALIPVPKEAKQIAFAFTPMNSSDPLAKADPPVYVPLGIRGDFQPPIIPDNVATVKPATAYKVGQAVKAPKRGVAIQVNSVRERTDPVPEYTLDVTSKLVILDVTTRTFGDSKPLIPARELSLTGSDGKTLKTGLSESSLVTRAESSRGLNDDSGRGLLVFVGSRDAKNLTLKFRPLDSTSTVMQSKYLDDETISFDLSGAVTEATSQFASASAPKLADPSTIPAEIKKLGVPQGFAPEAGSAKRDVQDGKFSSAKVSLFGNGTVQDVVAYYQKAMQSGWEDNGTDVTEHAAMLEYFDTEEGSTNVQLSISEYAGGIRVAIEMFYTPL